MKNWINSGKIAIDSNIIIYAIEGKDLLKKQVSLGLLERKPYLSNQVLSEISRVLSRKEFQMKKDKIIDLVLYLLDFCPLIINDKDVYRSAKFLMKRYKISLADSIVVANALLEGCYILYTEDMHHSLLIENKLKIINPFL
ncbi:hypothetical protein BPO_0585 [Bergeyella porcorum]|uniref:PIN domain-containing protein n=1 Tax=Bergeyella porcorum TaxID=1735111 RepID=A0AAU0F1Q7_9FLAO